MKKILLTIAVLTDVVCWNWILDSRSLISVVAFFALFLLTVALLPKEKAESAH